MRKVVFSFIFLVVLAMATQAHAACTPTGFFRDGINMTAAMINPPTVTGYVNAVGCNIGVYYDEGHSGIIKDAEIYFSNYFGVLVNGDDGAVSVDVINSIIHDIGESPLNGTQHGVGIYYRAFNDTGSATGKVSGNHLLNYQKGGIVVNGQGSNVLVQNNIVDGQGPVSYIAQNGIQFGWGSNGSAMKNSVTGHSYTGTSTASGGVIVVGGGCYGSPLTTGIQIVQNTVKDNDVGVWLSNIEADCLSAPSGATNNKVVNNTITNDALTNHYGGSGYQAGVADQGNNDKIIANQISGDGYNSASNPTAYTVNIDADPSFTNRPKVHANK